MKKGNGKKKQVLRERAAGIMIEEYDSKLDLVVEKIGSLDQKVTEGFNRVEMRLDRVELEIVGIRVLLGEQDAAIKRHDQDISLLKQASSH